MPSKYIYPATLLADFYKVSHKEQYPDKTEVIYSTWTPRASRIKGVDKVVMFGLQSFIKSYLIEYFNENFFARPKEDVVAEYKRIIKFSLGIENPNTVHIEELHDLGYLPISIKALKEGMLAPIKVPMIVLYNTHPKFFWLTNYLETMMSTEIWMPMTSATIAHKYRSILDKYALKTVGHTDDVGFQLHDFSMRGMASIDASKASGAGHLLSFTGTDAIPSILYLEKFYNANVEAELVGASINATEHSVMSANTGADGDRDEYEAFKRLITEVYPNGFVSVVSDTYDFWRNIKEVLPRLKDAIMARDGRVVIRPDSGNPVDIICGKYIEDFTGQKYVKSLDDAKDNFYEQLMDNLRVETPHGEYGETEVEGQFKFEGKYYELEIEVEYNRYDKQYYFVDDHNEKRFEEFEPSLSDLGLIESLWNVFGGTISATGYKVLDTHIGAIYGDAITLERAEEICKRLEEKGFASTNIVLGVGSYSYQYNTRDTFGFAMKATYAVIDGEEIMLFKDPKTDDGTKRSQRGMVAVVKIGDELHCEDGLDKRTYDANFTRIDQLEPVFLDGKLLRDESLSDIRKLLSSQ